MPRYSRVCPYCCYDEAFSVEHASILYPHSLLRQMRELVDEAQRGVTRGVMYEIVATFETLKSVILLSFDDNRDVMRAVELMEDLLDELSKRQRRQALWRGGVVVVLVTILLSSLFVLVC